VAATPRQAPPAPATDDGSCSPHDAERGICEPDPDPEPEQAPAVRPSARPLTPQAFVDQAGPNLREPSGTGDGQNPPALGPTSTPTPVPLSGPVGSGAPEPQDPPLDEHERRQAAAQRQVRTPAAPQLPAVPPTSPRPVSRELAQANQDLNDARRALNDLDLAATPVPASQLSRARSDLAAAEQARRDVLAREEAARIAQADADERAMRELTRNGLNTISVIAPELSPLTGVLSAGLGAIDGDVVGAGLDTLSVIPAEPLVAGITKRVGPAVRELLTGAEAVGRMRAADGTAIGKLGDVVATGLDHTVVEAVVDSRRDLVVKLDNTLAPRRAVVDQAEDLGKLRESGIPTGDHGLVDITNDNGGTTKGLLMDRIDGVEDIDIVQALDQAVPDRAARDRLLREGTLDPADLGRVPPSWKLVNEKTVADLEAIRDNVRRDGISIEDFQYRVSEVDGSVYVTDTDGVRKGAAADPEDVQLLLSQLDDDINTMRGIVSVNGAP
jgi:hypothetical protein